MGRVAVILPAAGSGRRFGGLQKKTFALLDGKPVWQRAAELFWSRRDVAKVLIVLDPADRDDFVRRNGATLAFAEAELVDGGAERFESVANALARVPADVELVAVHDAVRPLTTQPQIDAVFQSASETGAALLAVPLADTLKEVEASTNRVLGTRPRAGLWQAQTPQVFRRELLAEAYSRRAELAGPITDDAQLVEALGHAVTVVPGSAANFKITVPADLALAEVILRGRGAPEPAKRPARPFQDEEW